MEADKAPAPDEGVIGELVSALKRARADVHGWAEAVHSEDRDEDMLADDLAQIDAALARAEAHQKPTLD